MCTCIKEINERMERKHYAVGSVVGSNNSQSSEVRFRPITLAGKHHQHSRGESVKWKYCPFCGQELRGG